MFLEGGCGYIDETEQLVIAPRFKYCRKFTDGLAGVQTETGWTFIDTSGAVVFQPDGTDCRGSLADGMVIRENGLRTARYTFIKRDGTLLAPFIFDWADGFIDDLAAVRIEGAVGFIDSSGVTVIAPQFDPDPSFMCSRGFSEGVSAVMIHGKCGYIDKTGSIAIEPRFTLARPFESGLAQVCVNEWCGYVDHTGAVVWMSAAR